jgi:hypothetical protein
MRNGPCQKSTVSSGCLSVRRSGAPLPRFAAADMVSCSYCVEAKCYVRPFAIPVRF